MVSFESDYIAGAHPEIIKRLTETNLEALSGYGTDKYCESAKQKIKNAIGLPSLDVEFLAGGTQTNEVVISTVLKDYEGVISADTGHIHAHEAGAVEFTGHKIIALPHKNGKIEPDSLKNLLLTFYADKNHEHMVFPGMVYISHPTEYGTLYSKEELKSISEICHEYGISLFMDGARLGYALMSKNTDLTLKDIAELCDIFYIGGTKVGALCGEAVVFTKNNKPPHFMTSVKRHGALLAKGRILGVQFDALFTDNLYFKIGEYAINMAEKLKNIFISRDFTLFIDSPTNQQFVVLENRQMEQLSKKVAFGFWEKADANHTVVRFATSWSTTEADLTELENALDELSK